MTNMTMTIDTDVLKKAKKIAIEKDTTVSALVRAYLEHLADKKEQATEIIISELKDYFSSGNIIIGKKNWKREDIHER